MIYRTSVRVTLAVLAVGVIAACTPMGPSPDDPPDSTATSLRPDAFSGSAGSPTSVGCTGFAACLNDETDATYISVDAGDEIDVSFEDQPGVTSWTAGTLRVRMSHPAGAATLDAVDLITNNGAKLLVAAGPQSVTPTITDYTFTLTGLPTTQNEVNNVLLRVYETSSQGTQDFRIHRAEVEVTP